MIITDNNRDYLAGALIALIGAGAVYQGSQYGIGSLHQMESGFFPTMLGAGMIVVGAGIAATANQAPSAPSAVEEVLATETPRMDWRSWLAIIGGVCLFMACSEYLGLLPAIFACVFVSALGARATSVREALVLATGVTIFGILLFSYGLKVQIPILRGF